MVGEMGSSVQLQRVPTSHGNKLLPIATCVRLGIRSRWDRRGGDKCGFQAQAAVSDSGQDDLLYLTPAYECFIIFEA